MIFLFKLQNHEPSLCIFVSVSWEFDVISHGILSVEVWCPELREQCCNSPNPGALKRSQGRIANT